MKGDFGEWIDWEKSKFILITYPGKLPSVIILMAAFTPLCLTIFRSAQQKILALSICLIYSVYLQFIWVEILADNYS